MFGTIANAFGSLIGAAGQNANINKQIAAQSRENEKNRQYNLQLAQMQNQWSVEQWERENEYNSPVNQMSRLKTAGINPNLAYSNGVSNLSAASPGMTSGAPSSPVDMSALGQRATLGQTIQLALTNEAQRAAIDNTKAQTRKTLADAGISETQAKYEDVKQSLGIDITRQQFEANKLSYEKLIQEVEQAKTLTGMMNSEAIIKGIDAFVKSEKTSHELKILANQAKISEQDAKFALESYAMRLLGLELDTKHKQYLSQFEYLLKDDKLADKALSVLAPVGTFLRSMFIK